MKTQSISFKLSAQYYKRQLFNLKINMILCLLIGNTIVAMGQKNLATTSSSTVDPIRGIYKMLASLSAKPTGSREAMDKLKFPFDQSWADKVLSIKPVYLKNKSTEDFNIPYPPANSSDQVRAELNYLISLQHSRTNEEITTSLYLSNNPQTPSDIGRSIGFWIEPQALPLTTALLENLTKDGNYFLWLLKFKYARVRPYTLEPKIHDMEESFASSYPSGHVTYAYIYAYFYQRLAPEFTDLFITNAYKMSYARQIVGVHYPSDCEGSKIFARQFVDLLFANEEFLKDFENVKKEWAAKKQVSEENFLKSLNK